MRTSSEEPPPGARCIDVPTAAMWPDQDPTTERVLGNTMNASNKGAVMKRTSSSDLLWILSRARASSPEAIVGEGNTSSSLTPGSTPGSGSGSSRRTRRGAAIRITSPRRSVAVVNDLMVKITNRRPRVSECPNTQASFTPLWLPSPKVLLLGSCPGREAIDTKPRALRMTRAISGLSPQCRAGFGR
jgi:hypothetical protein